MLNKEIEMEKRLQSEEPPAEKKIYNLRSRRRIGY